MNLTALLQKAQRAAPPKKARPCRWSPLMPAAEALLGKRHSLNGAVDWLVAGKAIPKAMRVRAYHSLRRAIQRRAKHEP